MAVQEQTPLREYTANGVTTSFALGFDCEETNHLIVTIDDVEVLPTDWYLSGSNVVFWTAPGNGKPIKLQRNTPFNRLADYQSYNNSFRPPAINKEFDRIWWKLQELGVADWILHNRIDALKNYVDDRDDELRAYLMEEIRKQGVALDQLDEYYNYLMQRLAQIAVDKGWDASFVVDGDKTQKEINRYIVQPFNPGRTYLLNERVQLENGDIVKSTVTNNTADPNLDMTGWVNTSHASQIIDLSGLNQQQVNDLKVDKKDVLPTTQTKDSFKNAYSTKRINQFHRLRDQMACGRAYIWKNPKYTSGSITVNPFTASSSNISGTATSGYTVELIFSTGEVRKAKASGTAWSLPNDLLKQSSDIVSSKSYDADYRFSLGLNQNGWQTAEWEFIADADDFYRMRYGYVGDIRAPSQTLTATNLSKTPQRAGDNAYFRSTTELNATFDVVFTGVGILFNHYVDNNGGVFEVSVDGGSPFILSTHVDNPQNSNAVSARVSNKIGGDLPVAEHTVTFKFIGDDPDYPPASGISRGWFKYNDGVEPEDYTANLITGAEMGLTPANNVLLSNNILEFAISATPVGSGFTTDWVPAHGSSSGCMVINKRSIFVDNDNLDDALSTIISEQEIKEFTMIQEYTAYNSNDTSKSYPMWEGKIITKFNRESGLSYSHEFWRDEDATYDVLVQDGYTASCSGQRVSNTGVPLFTKLTCDNGFSLDLSVPPPSTQVTHHAGMLKSVSWLGVKYGLAMNVESPEASAAVGQPTTDGNPTFATERPDRFNKVYFKPLGSNKLFKAGHQITSKHSILLAAF